MSRVCLQWKIQIVYLWEIITIDLFSYNSTKCYIRINKQLINLVYNDMKNLTYSLICFNCVQSVFWNIDRKALSAWDDHIDSFFPTTRKCFLRINKQLINLDYDDLKNLICFNGVQSVFWNIDRKALSVWDNHIDSFFTTTRKCLLWINKQLINLDYDDMKNLT